jgi:hypothetical protein
MGSALSILEMKGPISKLSVLVAQEIASSSTPDQFLKKANRVIKKVPEADARAVQHHLHCNIHEYSAQVYWLFAFVYNLHSLMSDSSTSLHDAIMREMIIDDASGMLVIMCHNSGAGKTVDLTRNATLRYVYDSVSVHNSMQMGGSTALDDFETSLHVCRLTLDCKVSNCLQVLMGIPNTYMKRMVAHLEPLVDGSTLSPVSSAHLNDLHRNITGLAVDMCVRSLRLLSELRNLAVEYSHTQVISEPYKNAFLVM